MRMVFTTVRETSSSRGLFIGHDSSWDVAKDVDVYLERGINVNVERMKMGLMLLQRRTKITSNLQDILRALA